MYYSAALILPIKAHLSDYTMHPLLFEEVASLISPIYPELSIADPK
jgi:hypothetical protein